MSKLTELLDAAIGVPPEPLAETPPAGLKPGTVVPADDLMRPLQDVFGEINSQIDRIPDVQVPKEQLIAASLREQYPHGHKSYLPITMKELQLHSDKNHDYAAGGKPTGNFDRVASILSNYPELNLGDPRVVALVYALKQFDAVLWGLNKNIEHKVEGLQERLGDIAVYVKIVMCMEDSK